MKERQTVQMAFWEPVVQCQNAALQSSSGRSFSKAGPFSCSKFLLIQAGPRQVRQDGLWYPSCRHLWMVTRFAAVLTSDV